MSVGSMGDDAEQKKQLMSSMLPDNRNKMKNKYGRGWALFSFLFKILSSLVQVDCTNDFINHQGHFYTPEL